MWIFGGCNLADFFNDMYYFDFTEMMWHRISYDVQRSMAVPTPRASSSLVYFNNSSHSGGCFYVFGGGNINQFFNDMFVFDIATRSWLLPSVSG